MSHNDKIQEKDKISFLRAAAEGDINILKYLVSKGIDVNGLNHKEQSALVLAALKLKYEAVELLIDKGASIKPAVVALKRELYSTQSRYANLGMGYLLCNKQEVQEASERFARRSKLIQLIEKMTDRQKFNENPQGWADQRISKLFNGVGREGIELRDMSNPGRPGFS